MPYKNKADHNAACLRRYHANKKPHADRMKEYYRKDIKGRLLSSAKYRAKQNDIPFDITVNDFEMPEFCPIFKKIRLEIGDGKHSPSSPSLDRIVPELGYVKGNVHVISHKANKMKNNGSLEELIELGRWAESVSKPI